MSEDASWLGYEALKEAEAALPRLLRDDRPWESLVTEASAWAKIERVYREFNGLDLFLIRITRMVCDVGFLDEPVHGAIAGRVVEGRISIAICDPRDAESHIRRQLLMATLSHGDCYAYRAGISSAYRLHSPTSLYVAVSQNTLVVNPNPASPETVMDILAKFRSYYPEQRP